MSKLHIEFELPEALEAQIESEVASLREMSFNDLDDQLKEWGIIGHHIPFAIPRDTLPEVQTAAEERYEDEIMIRMFVLGECHARLLSMSAMNFITSILRRRDLAAYRAGVKHFVRNNLTESDDSRNYCALILSAISGKS